MQTREKEIKKVTLIGSVVNLILLLLKFAAGIVGRSGAMIADAVHSLSDFVTDIVVLLCMRIAGKPQDATHNYGYGKFETLATVIIGVVLFAVGLQLLWNGGSKVYGFFFRGLELENPGRIAFAAALLSIVAKEMLYRYTAAAGRRLDSPAVVANAWHHRSDAFSSIGTAAGIGGAIVLGPRWNVLDPVAAMVVSLFILKVAVQLVLPAVNELLEKSLPREAEQEILDIISATDGVSNTHGLRTRSIGNGCSIEAQIRVDGAMTVAEADELTRDIETRLVAKFGENTYTSITVHTVI